MARGDVQTDGYIAISLNGTTTIQPGSGDEWMVTEIFADTPNGRFEMGDGSDFSDSIELPPAGGNTAATQALQLSAFSYAPRKLFITNSQYIRLQAAGAATIFSWTAIETK